ncbi:3095_t:CDS:10 [Ambispora leptoticha]|uniref:3095_t:CDS:1 n=1 Tax=Ambispora leptoticha TaxID=144679 RepID=A0A9N8YVE5_9GLOM|nr:3095_t:CDS:10 [Ambispora leptoticha]
MGRKEFVQDVKKLKDYLNGLNSRNNALIKGFDFQDPELNFQFQYKPRKFFTIQIFVNDSSLSLYPTKFSGFICVDGGTDKESNAAAELLQKASIENKSVGEIVAILTRLLCEHFRLNLPKELSVNLLRQFGGSANNSTAFYHPIQKSLIPVKLTPSMLLQRDLAELKHWNYFGELLCADNMGYKVTISMPVTRLGLSLEACEAWNLEPDRYIVCTMQFTKSYIDLENEVKNAYRIHSHVFKEGGGGYPALKDLLKKQYNIKYTVLTSSQQRGVFSQSHHKDDFLESDHFVLSWTLTELLRSKFFDMLCDCIWFGVSWGGAEQADLMRNKNMMHNYLYDGKIDRHLLFEQESHGQLCFFEAEKSEHASAVKNQNFLLIVLRFLRRRILLSTKYCLTCHYPHGESVSSIRPFVCGTPLCQHQSLVGLGNLFEAVLVNSPVVVDLLISLCYVAIQAQNLSPAPTKAIGVTTTSKLDGENTLAVEWSETTGTIGTPATTGYQVHGWKNFDNKVKQNDLLEVYNPDTKQPFPVNRSNTATTVRVLEVYSNYLITDFPIVFPISAAPNKPVYLPFRLLRRTECNFLSVDDTPNYTLLQTVIDRLPSVNVMVEYAKKKTLKAELDQLDLLCFPLLSWIISSNRTHLRLLESNEEKVQFNEGATTAYSNWKQFVMIMSSPEKEQEFQREKERLRRERVGQSLGELYAFHGSPLNNWHSIIRTSLNWKRVLHGRAYGDGVYHSLQAATSASYAGAPYHKYDVGVWKNSMLVVTKCMALSEIVNRPSQFTSTSPHLVVPGESWITTRYLFVECLRNPLEPTSEGEDEEYSFVYVPNSTAQVNSMRKSFKKTITNPFSSLRQRNHREKILEFIRLDTQYTPVWFNNHPLQIPKRDFLIIANEYPEDSSRGIGPFHYQFNNAVAGTAAAILNGSLSEDDILEDEDDYDNEVEDESENEDAHLSKTSKDKEPEPSKKYEQRIEIDDGFDPSLLPLPAESSKTATQRICKELRQIVQKQSEPNNDLSFSINTDMLQSMYQWVIQMKDFDSSLPLAQDMKKYKVKTIDMEVRFAPDYPFVPPYIRVIRPRLLRFMEGGGGHVTAGGSICMDLLTLGNNTERGWSSVYTMESVLLQVKIALSSLEPKPARLDPRRAFFSTTPTRPPSTTSSKSSNPPVKHKSIRTRNSLPTLVTKTRYIIYGALGVTVWIVAVAVAWNHERQSTSAIQGCMFNVRYSEEARAVLGDTINFASAWPWISGTINHLKGRINVWFRVKGEKGKGTVHFHSIRRGHGQNWQVVDFSLTTDDDGRVISLSAPSMEKYITSDASMTTDSTGNNNNVIAAT